MGKRNPEFYILSDDERYFLIDLLDLIQLYTDYEPEYKKTVKEALLEMYETGSIGVCWEPDPSGGMKQYTEVKVKIDDDKIRISLKMADGEIIHTFDNEHTFARGHWEGEEVQKPEPAVQAEEEEPIEIYMEEVPLRERILEELDFYMPSSDEVILANRAFSLLREYASGPGLQWQSRRRAVAALAYGYTAYAKCSGYYGEAPVWAEIQGDRAVICIEKNDITGRLTDWEDTVYFGHTFQHGRLTKEYVYLSDFPMKVIGGRKEAENELEQARQEAQERQRQEMLNRELDRQMELESNLEYARSYQEQFGTESTEMNEQMAWDIYNSGL